jgi:hypothetical protein
MDNYLIDSLNYLCFIDNYDYYLRFFKFKTRFWNKRNLRTKVLLRVFLEKISDL